MRKLMKNKEGFTLIELVMVIVILGILAAVAVPKFGDMTIKAKYAAQMGVAGSVRSGITMQFALSADQTYPTVLDAVATGTAAAPGAGYFINVLDQGGCEETYWNKTGALVYTCDTGHATGVNEWTYTPATGQFQHTTIVQ